MTGGGSMVLFVPDINATTSLLLLLIFCCLALPNVLRINEDGHVQSKSPCYFGGKNFGPFGLQYLLLHTPTSYYHLVRYGAELGKY